MYTKSFLARNSAGRLTGARMAQRSAYQRYTCHQCGCALVLHTDAERPWFEHSDAALTEHGRQRCPYLHPATDGVLFIRLLRRYVPDARLVVSGSALCHPVLEVTCA